MVHVIEGARANYNIRVKLHRNLLLQEAAFFDSTEPGILLSRLNNDVHKIGNVISLHVNVILRQSAQFIFGSVYLLKLSPRLSFFAFGGIALVLLVSAIYGDFSRGLAEMSQEKIAEASAVAETSFTMSETVRAFDGVDTETHKYEIAQGAALNCEEIQAWAYGTHKFISDNLEAGLLGGLLFACYLIGRTGQMPLSTLTTFMFYVKFVLESSNEVGDQWAKVQSAVGATSNVFGLIRRIPAIHDPIQSQISSSQTNTENYENVTIKNEEECLPIIDMDHMSVTYGEMNTPALNNVDLKIYPGDRVAIVGRSGSGKSSMLRTVLRFYDPSFGACKLDGTSLTEYTRKQISKHISVVEQEPHLFPMTLIENILYGIEKDSVDEETKEECYGEDWRNSVSEALKASGLPVGGDNDLGLELDTRVGEGGRTLSGGQRQVCNLHKHKKNDTSCLLLFAKCFVSVCLIL